MSGSAGGCWVGYRGRNISEPMRIWMNVSRAKLPYLFGLRCRYFSLLGRALAAWLAEITPNPDRMALWAHIRMVAASMLLSEVWLAWADEFVPACVAEREAACRAAVHWRAARLRICLRRWHATAEECVHERDACLRARSFHERRVRRHCLMGWYHWAAAKVCSCCMGSHKGSMACLYFTPSFLSYPPHCLT
jgi:hypothetical protein